MNIASASNDNRKPAKRTILHALRCRSGFDGGRFRSIGVGQNRRERHAQKNHGTRAQTIHFDVKLFDKLKTYDTAAKTRTQCQYSIASVFLFTCLSFVYVIVLSLLTHFWFDSHVRS